MSPPTPPPLPPPSPRRPRVKARGDQERWGGQRRDARRGKGGRRQGGRGGGGGEAGGLGGRRREKEGVPRARRCPDRPPPRGGAHKEDHTVAGASPVTAHNDNDEDRRGRRVRGGGVKMHRREGCAAAASCGGQGRPPYASRVARVAKALPLLAGHVERDAARGEGGPRGRRGGGSPVKWPPEFVRVGCASDDGIGQWRGAGGPGGGGSILESSTPAGRTPLRGCGGHPPLPAMPAPLPPRHLQPRSSPTLFPTTTRPKQRRSEARPFPAMQKKKKRHHVARDDDHPPL